MKFASRRQFFGQFAAGSGAALGTMAIAADKNRATADERKLQPVRKIHQELYAPGGPDGIWWLGQVGFAIRIGERYLMIDPVMTENSVAKIESYWKMWRVHEYPLEPPEVKRADHVMYTHEHDDHMDPGLFPRLRELKTKIVAPAHSKSFILAEGVGEDQIQVLRAGESLQGDGYTIEAARARHGNIMNQLDSYPDVKDKDACVNGYLIKTRYGNIYHPGDTYYLSEMTKLEVDYLLLPLSENNLGTSWAAHLTAKLQPRVVIPCHYGMFDPPTGWQGGHPVEYLTVLLTREYEVPRTDVMILRPGGRVLLG